MKPKAASEDSKRTRRYIFIDNALYKMVAREAVDRGVDYGAIVDEALKDYFERLEKGIK